MDLSATIPPQFGNLSFLVSLDMSNNKFHGDLPEELANLRRLKYLNLRENQISGSVPANFFNISTLEKVDFTNNNLSGNLPANMCRHSQNLEYFSVYSNLLSGEIPQSIGECSRLQTLLLQFNQFTGPVPKQIGNLSMLVDLYLGDNNFKGEIPGEIGELHNLEYLTLDEVGLRGPISSFIYNISTLQWLYLGQNNLTGDLPMEICLYLPAIQGLYLGQNQMTGSIPKQLGNCSSLVELYLDANMFTGELTLSKNKLYGPVPACLSNITALRYLNLDSNELNSSISPSIGGLRDLLRLQGPIPDLLGNIISLERLDLSHNNLTGAIPKSMEELQHLEYLNISFNKLTGEIPNGGPFGHFNYQSFISNDALCGSPRLSVHACRSDNHHKRLKTLLRVLLIPLAIVSTVFALTASVFLIKRRRKNKVPTQIDLLRTVMLDRISYRDVEIATDRFSESNLLGIGSFGAFKSFDTECEVLRNIRHRNLTKVVSSCTNLDFRALILEYMPNGSLEKLLYSQNEVLNLQQRLSIMIDVASAIDYLHYGYGTPIVHCDLKPSNVLLDESMVVHVSDFGIAKLVNAEDSEVQTKTLATFGYIAPEFGSEGLVSTRCDVYSFGIMLMETFTRKRPTDDLFTGGLSLRSWINDSYPHSLIHLVDATLIEPQDESLEKKVDCISLIMKLALDCSVELPGERTNMKDALATLQKIGKQFL
ncbi:hypothetical protein DH2020_042324 [Rehmannia glutinosa]|uniref:Protein kinase domain-containing protein n=1 Tax=Rehmannia glutinosa TaxID=99300 RepID=A0ABR0UMT1_REHGL